jgi:iron(III) transport system permease protein
MSLAKRWDATILPTAWTLEHMRAVFREERTWNAIANSLNYAAFSTLACILLGLAVSYLVVRLRIVGSAALDTLSMLPLAVPGLVMAAGYIALTRPGSWLESIGPVQNPTILLVVAYTVRRLPYMVRSVSAGLQQTSETLEEAAQNLGASRLWAVLRITVPLILANILAGALLTFSFNMLEVSDSLVLAQTTRYYPITKQIFSLVGLAESRNLAAAMGVYAMVLLGGAMLAANALLGKRMGQLFRI